MVGLIVAFFVGGDRPHPSQTGIPEASLFVQWALPITRSIVDLLAAATVGLLLAAAALLPSPKDLLAATPARAARLASWLAWAWAALALVVVVLSYAETFATTVAGSLGPTKLLSFVSQSEQGSAWLVAAALAAFAGVVAREADRPLGAWVALLLAIGATLPPAVTGHAASAGDHDLATSSLVVHIVAWCCGSVDCWRWSGTRAPMVGISHWQCSASAQWPSGLSSCVGVSGAVNALIRLGDISALFTTQYGAVVLIKVMAFIALGIAGVGTPPTHDPAGSERRAARLRPTRRRRGSDHGLHDRYRRRARGDGPSGQRRNRRFLHRLRSCWVSPCQTPPPSWRS